MKVAALQHDIVWEDRDANFARLAPMIASGGRRRRRLVVLTEMFSTGFSMDVDRVAELPDGPSAEFLAGAGARARRVGVRFDARNGPQRAPGRSISSCSRRPTARFTATPRSTRSGTAPSRSTTRPATRSSPSTSRASAARSSFATTCASRTSSGRSRPRTDCYVVVANWPRQRRAHWSALLVARAIENQAFVVGVNRVGTGDGLTYVGDSVILDPLGEPVAAAGGEECVIIGEVDADAGPGGAGEVPVPRRSA